MNALLLLFAIREAVGFLGTVGRLSLQHTKQILIHQLKACFELLTGLMAKQITQKEHIFSYFLLPRNLFVTMLCTKIVLLLYSSIFFALSQVAALFNIYRHVIGKNNVIGVNRYYYL